MKKKTLPIVFLTDGIICLVSLALAVYENQNSSTGMAALTSMGRWVAYAGVFMISLIVFVILGILILLRKRKKER